jgi:hypothetical protein
VSLSAAASFGEWPPSFQVYCRRRGTHERRVDRCYWTTTRVLPPGISLAIAHLLSTCPSTPRDPWPLFIVRSAATSIHRGAPSACAPHRRRLRTPCHCLSCLVPRNHARAKGGQSGFKHSKSRSDISGRLAPATQGRQGAARRRLTARNDPGPASAPAPANAAGCSPPALVVAAGWLRGFVVLWT